VNQCTSTLAYAAGLFDGEGCISMDRARAQTLHVSVEMTDAPTIQWLQTNFGGTISIGTPKAAHHRLLYKWQLINTAAVEFLVAIRPHLITKNLQAWLASAWPPADGYRLSVENRALRTELYWALREAKEPMH
jgi:hypothetical protein